ncbi:MAG: ferrochelatase [Magnetococcales bacterium]|nr:ferrochelatase [Magnetococcales bacterium]
MSNSRTGLLLTQLGTPDAPTPAAVRRYLKQFLSDRRVVDLNRALWWPLLHGIILNTRPKRSAALYQKIWRKDGQSPLLHHTREVTLALQKRLGEGIQVQFAMRYGNPGIPSVLAKMLDQGVERLLLFPLYPQFSASTTASTADAFQAALAHRRFIPAFRMASPFYADPGYIAALAHQVRATPGYTPHALHLFSFHSLPQRHVDEGDPYGDHCAATAQRLANALGLADDGWRLTFQSRFGREPWLTPGTDTVLEALPKEGVKRVVAVCPGFVSDCLETLEEIGKTERQRFLAAGGESFLYVPCLNESPQWIDALTRIVRRELSGWES